MLEINSILLDQYKILNIAGKGGMGRVYRAVDIYDHSEWAIKEDLSDSFSTQLYEEADVLMGLEHPALPKTRGVKTWQKNQYMIMQYCTGETLAAKLKQQEKFPEQQVLDWFLQICDVLCYLHSRPRPIVYRDLKPSNIIIDGQNRVKIIDFGIAEEYAGQDGDAPMQKGGLTKGYAAPEQYSHRFKADVRTDIYALGVTIHYLLTGKDPLKPPYEFLPVRKLSPDVSPAMEEIVKKCLQPNPDMRYESADALYRDLTHIDEKNQAIRRKKQKRQAAAAVIVGLALIVSFLIGTTVKNRRQAQIDEYYTMVENAREMADSGDYESSIHLAEQAIQSQPNELSGYLAMSYCYIQQGEFALCREYISREVLDRFPDCYENVEFLGIMAQMCDLSGDLDNALFYYRNRCDLDSGKPEFWLDLSDCLIRTGNYEEAGESLRKYLDAGGDVVLHRQLMEQISK